MVCIYITNIFLFSMQLDDENEFHKEELSHCDQRLSSLYSELSTRNQELSSLRQELENLKQNLSEKEKKCETFDGLLDEKAAEVS